MGTYARLGAQHERLNYTETLLDKASTSTREADVSTKKLKSLNRSMFAVHVNNPFTSTKRTKEMEERTLSNHRADRDMRDATRKAGYDSNSRMEQGFKEIDKAQRSTDKWSRSSGAEKSKYAFEDDSEDDANEDRIDDAMVRTAGHVTTLNSVAKLMGKEIEGQNQLIDRLGDKVRYYEKHHTRTPANSHLECPARRRCQAEYGETEAHPLSQTTRCLTRRQQSMCICRVWRVLYGFRIRHMARLRLVSAAMPLDSWVLAIDDEIDTMKKVLRALFWTCCVLLFR